MATSLSTMSRFRFRTPDMSVTGRPAVTPKALLCRTRSATLALQISFLSGKAVGIRAGTADPPALNDRCLFTGLRQVPGKILAAFSAADDDVFSVFGFHS